ncbi:MAG: TonB-dependent receptor [Bacteroidetes bacterium]|nr:TonB-dependent receptor [Bacteroidota bacterium]
MKKTLSLLFVLCTTALLTAQEEPVTLQPVQIKGRKKNTKELYEFKRHAQSVEVLNNDDLNRNNPAFIEQSLNTMSGVQVDKRTQLGGQRIVVRGYGNDQKFNNWGIKIYYNNMPLTTADGTTILDDVDFSIVDNIEVIKGPASSQYGAGVGGTVRLYVKTPAEEGLSIEQKTTLGSFKLFQSSSQINYKNNKTSMFLNYGHLESNGYRLHGASLKNFVSYMGDFALSDHEKMSLFLGYNKSYEQVAGQISYADYYAGIDYGNSAYLKKNAGNDLLSTRVGVSYENQFANHFKNNTTVFYYSADFTRIAAGAYEVSKNPNYGVRSVFSYTKDLNANYKNELRFGTELQQSTSLISNYRFTGTDDNNPLQVSNIAKASYFNYTNNQFSFFAEDRLEYQPYQLAFVVGLSANKIKFNRQDLLALPGLITDYNKDLSFSKSFNMTYNPHIAVQKTYKNQIVNLSYSYGYNAPTAATSFISATHQTNDGLAPEKARMLDLSVHGLLFDTHFDYQVAVYDMQIQNKLTQLSAINPQGGAAYTYWANTGNQQNRGMELSLGYVYEAKNNSLFKTIQPFASCSINDFRYQNFQTQLGSSFTDYKGQLVVGVPNSKYTMGLDFKFQKGFYLQNTFHRVGNVYTDFANTHSVKGFEQFNAKLGYQKEFMNKKLTLDIYVAGNNLTNQINYTFLFLGNSINDSDTGSNYPAGVATDVNPGAAKAYYFGGIHIKYAL